MRTFFDCIPCFVRQTLDSVRRATDDETVHEQVLRETLRTLSEMNLRDSPPAMGHKIHRFIRERVGESDPYREMKDESNQLALEVYPALKSRVEYSADPLDTAVRLAIAGNIMDVAVKGDVGQMDVHEAIEDALAGSLDGDLDEFAKAVSTADSILYLADNAGEIVLDRLLIERLPIERVTVAVRGGPIINDATMVDARVAGITELVAVIDNGADVPGTILDECSAVFRRRFNEADLVIAKGQGNYETLSEVGKDLFFSS
jgi:damage-control phosphatase, subfamily I